MLKTCPRSEAVAAITEGELLVTVSDAAFGEVVRGHLQSHTVTGQNAYAISPQLAGQVSQYRPVLVQLDAK